MLSFLPGIIFGSPILAIIYIVLCLVLGILGRHKIMGFWGYFFGSILLTPVIGLLLLLVSGKRQES